MTHHHHGEALVVVEVEAEVLMSPAVEEIMIPAAEELKIPATEEIMILATKAKIDTDTKAIMSHSLTNQILSAISVRNHKRMPIWTSRSDAGLPLSKEKQKGILKQYDKDGNGRLSKKELKVAFHNPGLHFSSWRARKAFRQADANGDGYISEDEMKNLITYSSRWGFKS
ncbi:hypothetical protein F0562_027676 [Nyssa sinensis]|uniref:EF-hand domain-containing protein n=1 Tax=Nyssa sinensis TaxID=561372 RepID=A0A5J5B5E0_9ASTE|nr:hypothetical protein F0562_027676 [Nyssa sinensis]